MPTQQHWVVRPQTPEEIYTDRQEYLDHFYKMALDAITRRSYSMVLLGQRRMGKTEIFLRVVNRLFFEQDHTDPQAAVPVFFTFPDEAITREEFALKYVMNFVRWYAAFRLRNLDLLRQPEHPRDLAAYVQDHLPISKGFSHALGLMEAIERGGMNLPAEWALQLPRSVSDRDDSTIVMFLDEMQNAHLPEFGFRVVGFLQQAVESTTCPHFATGSSMSMLTQVLGTGSLYGRFWSKEIESFTDYWGAELALRAARYYQAELPEMMAPVVSDRCGGNPYYITSVIRQAANQGAAVDDETTLNEMLAIDISSGFIWGELHNQVSRWIAKINEHGITKWILYLSVLETEPRINLERIQQELWQRERKHVNIETIKDVLVKLSRGDLIDYKAFGNWFGKMKDPILNEFLKVWGRIEVGGEERNQVSSEMVTAYKALQRKFHDYKGYVAEVFLSQVLWNAQRKTLPGVYFHSPQDVQIPRRFFYIDQRHRMRAGKGAEVDVYAAAGGDLWLVESKCWIGRKVGPKEAQHLIDQGEIVQEREGDIVDIRLWLFAHDGVTPEAEKLLTAHKVLWSTRADLDALLAHLNLRTLPKLATDVEEEHADETDGR